MLPESAAELLLLHNPRCSKSRAAKALLDERDVSYVERRYLEQPLSRAELGELARRLARPASDWTRTQEPSFAQLGIAKTAPDAALLDAIALHPELLERPVLVRGDRAVVGRPPEAILALLGPLA